MMAHSNANDEMPSKGQEQILSVIKGLKIKPTYKHEISITNFKFRK